MSIKILGGEAKGLALDVPDSEHVRPTTVMLKRKIFDAHQNLEDKIFYDLCSGSGAMGLEALSRGAAKVIFVENDKRAIKSLQNNIKTLEKNIPDIQQRVMIHHQGLEHFLKYYLNSTLDGKENSIIFFDPPYVEEKLYLQFYKALADLLQFEGELWIEACEQKSTAKTLAFPEFFIPVKRYNHSHHFIAIFKLQ